MKKLITNGLFALGLVLSAGGAKAQAVSQGNVIIDPYYGFPNFGKKIASSFSSENANLTTNGSGGIGPAGLRVEYMLADKFGLGVDVIYNSASIDLTYDSLNTDGSLYRRYTGTGQMSRLRVQARFNYHFVQTDDLDVYAGVGAGTNTRFWSAKSNDPDYDFNSRTRTATILPVSMRVALGMRYYFLPNLGVNAEIGLGGPMVSAGLSLKF